MMSPATNDDLTAGAAMTAACKRRFSEPSFLQRTSSQPAAAMLTRLVVLLSLHAVVQGEFFRSVSM